MVSWCNLAREPWEQRILFFNNWTKGEEKKTHKIEHTRFSLSCTLIKSRYISRNTVLVTVLYRLYIYTLLRLILNISRPCVGNFDLIACTFVTCNYLSTWQDWNKADDSPWKHFNCTTTKTTNHLDFFNCHSFLRTRFSFFFLHAAAFSFSFWACTHCVGFFLLLLLRYCFVVDGTFNEYTTLWRAIFELWQQIATKMFKFMEITSADQTKLVNFFFVCCYF